MANLTDIGTLNIRTPETVKDAQGSRERPSPSGALRLVKLGLTPEEIVVEIPHLTLAPVYAALAYYHANRDEIEQDIAEEEAIAEQLAQQYGKSHS